MQYDPIKRKLGNLFNRSPFLRKLFYRLLDLLLLRSWHIHKELNRWSAGKGNDVKILDAGSGFGQYSYWLSSKNPNWKILAVDVKEEQVADCNRFFQQAGRENVKFEIADLTRFSHPAEYDLVISIDVMEHILEDVQVFKNFVASMKKGAMLIISTPSDQGGSDVNEDHPESFIEEHVRDGYNMKEIEDKLYSAGFSKVEARYTYGTPGKISWRLSMKYPITFLGKVPHIIGFILLPFYYIIAYPISFVLNYFDVNGKHKTGTGLLVKAWK
jgi:2-polyprenyl-3-methyl-5-hydroxy-6-metoxy-1,4-benzoquinol methylase